MPTTFDAFAQLPLHPNGLPPHRERPRQHLILRPHEHQHAADWFTAYIQEHQLSTQEMADRCQMSSNYLNAIRSDRHLHTGKAPTYRFVRQIAHRLGVTLETIIGPPLPAESPTPVSPLATPETQQAIVEALRAIETTLERIKDVLALTLAETVMTPGESRPSEQDLEGENTSTTAP